MDQKLTKEKVVDGNENDQVWKKCSMQKCFLCRREQPPPTWRRRAFHWTLKNRAGVGVLLGAQTGQGGTPEVLGGQRKEVVARAGGSAQAGPWGEKQPGVVDANGWEVKS